MQDKTRISQDLGTPAARKEQSLRVLCAYKKAMLATGASGRLPAQNDSVDFFSTSDWSVGSRCLTFGSKGSLSWRLHVLAAASRPRRTDLLRTAVAFVVVVCRAWGCLNCLPTVCDMSGISVCRFSGGGGWGADPCGGRWPRLECRALLVQVPSPPAPHPRPFPLFTLCAWLLPLFYVNLPTCVWLLTSFGGAGCEGGGGVPLYEDGGAVAWSTLCCSGSFQWTRGCHGGRHMWRRVGPWFLASNGTSSDRFPFALLFHVAISFFLFFLYFLCSTGLVLSVRGLGGREMRMTLFCEGGRGGCDGS